MAKKKSKKDISYKEFKLAFSSAFKKSSSQKKKLKSTKKAIQSRISYKKTKVKKLAKELKKYNDRDETTKKKFEGRKRTHKTIHDILSNRILDANKEINKEAKLLKQKPKLKKFKDVSRKGLKKGDQLLRIGNLWNRSQLEEHLKHPKIKEVNGFKKSTHFPEIHNNIDEMFINAYDKYAQIILVRNLEKGTAQVYLTGAKPDQKFKKD